MMIPSLLVAIATRALGRYATPRLAQAAVIGTGVVLVLAALTWVYVSIEAAGYARRDREVRAALARKNAEIGAVMAENAALMAAAEMARQAAVDAALARVPASTGTTGHLPADLLARLNKIK